MTKLNEIYKCSVCGNVVQVLVLGGGTLVCCGKEMNLMEEKTLEQEGKEKHVPAILETEKGVTVRVGSVEHPMEEEHYIQLIQLFEDDRLLGTKALKPGEKPEAEFCVKKNEKTWARELCNVHGLWKS